MISATKISTKKISRTACVIAAGALAAVLLILSGCGSSTGSSAGTSQSTQPSSSSTSYVTEATGEYAQGKHHAVVSVEGFDPFTIELDADTAPVTVWNFCTQAQKGTYNGTTFHRIVKDFCLQGGDPTGTGEGTGDTTIVGEFSANGIANALADNYKTGTVAMARTSEMNSASLQWFITLSDAKVSSLNGKYAAFGTIDDAGMQTVNAIVDAYIGKATGSSGAISSKADQPVITSVTIID